MDKAGEKKNKVMGNNIKHKYKKIIAFFSYYFLSQNWWMSKINLLHLPITKTITLCMCVVWKIDNYTFVALENYLWIALQGNSTQAIYCRVTFLALIELYEQCDVATLNTGSQQEKLFSKSMLVDIGVWVSELETGQRSEIRLKIYFWRHLHTNNTPYIAILSILFNYKVLVEKVRISTHKNQTLLLAGAAH
jgi:hypothetical protein